MHSPVVAVPPAAEAIRVMKFGGTSLGTTPERLRAVAERIAGTHRAGRPVVAVVSARGSTADVLEADVRAVSAAPPAREVDQLLATGPGASAALLAIALTGMGVPAAALTGAQAGVAASGPHGDGRLTAVDGTRLRELLRRRTVAVVAGGQAADAAGDVVTFGRGGSDTTAVALAAALGVTTCEVLTDVAGVHTADPRITPEARLLPVISSGLMAEMAYSGASVLHPQAVEIAAGAGVRIHVRSAFSDQPGTTVVPEETGENMWESAQSATAIAHDTEVARVVIRPGGLSHRGLELFAALAEVSVPVDLVSRVGDGDIGHGWDFTVARRHVAALREVLGRLACPAEIHDPVAKISLIGTGLLSRPLTTGRMLAALGQSGIDAYSVSTSQIRTAFTVSKVHCARAVELLHREFRLDQPVPALGHPVAV
ncbi:MULTISPECIES: aspartate kinase [unclassified Streptomyces]|uniref:aspartate kinase n=1 Tax=unclassified Streptomyces TaxID=2593676 RepID=UPI000A7B7966|nr:MULTISPECIES: aspartate kinase [unclassified Streptomyces]